MIQVVSNNNIEDILTFPQYYVDSSQDLALLRIYHSNDINNPTYIMIGCDEYDKYYLVVEDNETSEDYIPEDGQSLTELFEKLLDENK
jgi:hypothetical protein